MNTAAGPNLLPAALIELVSKKLNLLTFCVCEQWLDWDNNLPYNCLHCHCPLLRADLNVIVAKALMAVNTPALATAHETLPVRAQQCWEMSWLTVQRRML